MNPVFRVVPIKVFIGVNPKLEKNPGFVEISWNRKRRGYMPPRLKTKRRFHYAQPSVYTSDEFKLEFPKLSRAKVKGFRA